VERKEKKKRQRGREISSAYWRGYFDSHVVSITVDLIEIAANVIKKQ
jgi:hypothetical protein